MTLALLALPYTVPAKPNLMVLEKGQIIQD